MIPDLIKEFDEHGNFVIWNFGYVDDGYGGQKASWTPGATFEATVTLDDSIEMKVAQAQGVKGVYRVTKSRSVKLPWHTVFQSADGENTYRVTSRKENSAPSSASFDISYVSAEDYEMTASGNMDDDNG